MSSMITATAWVPRGHAAAFPTKYVFDEDEYARISKLAKLELDNAKEDLEAAKNALADPDSAPVTARTGSATTNGAAHDNDDDEDENDEDDDLKEYDMDHYDDDGDQDDEAGSQDEEGEDGGLFGNVKSLAYHTDNQDDPYITLQENEASDDEEREELQILPTDNMVLAARIEDEVAHLEAYVYEDSADNLYVHHDVMLPAIPLCVEWLSAKPGNSGEPVSYTHLTLPTKRIV